jgi:hypothetical protein
MGKMYSVKEKAEELIDKFTMDNTSEGERRGIKCALICVDEIRDNLPLITDVQNYWIDVKNEIEKYNL